ncbi:Titin-like protein [Aphelenchoides besseyi]|nr:Titin-like protein [Aphelenchoides besseyi]
MMTESASLEAADGPLMSVDEQRARTLQSMSDEQLRSLVDVVVSDAKMKFDLYSMVRQLQLTHWTIEQKFQPRFDRCSFCSKGFGFGKRKRKECQNCERYTCSSCLSNSICECCATFERLVYKREEFNILCSLPSNCFGAAKFKALAAEERRIETDEWGRFARLELHLQLQLHASVELADVDFVVSDFNLENARQELILAFLDFNNDVNSHFALIDAAILKLQKLVREESSWLETEEKEVHQKSFFSLLANAVVWIITRPKDLVVRSHWSREHMEDHKPFVPALSTEDLRSIESNTESTELKPNWFAVSNFQSPRGSLRSQFSSHVVNSITTPELFRYGDHHQSSDEEKEEQTNDMIRIDRRRIEASEGQMIRICCQVDCVDPSVQILWYARNRQLRDSPRVQVYRPKANQSNLEIFDCSAVDDAGDIVCLAVGEFGVVSDVCHLKIKDSDIAGEEPNFLQPLTVSNYSPTSGSAIQFDLSCSGYPRPYVSFYHNNLRIQSNNRRSISHDDSKWSLRVTNCSPVDSGTYAAIIRNRCGRIATRLDVKVQPIDMSDKPTKVKEETKIVSLTFAGDETEMQTQRKNLLPSNLSVCDVRF